MTKSAVKAYGKVYLIFHTHIPKTYAHLYRQHTDLKSTGTGSVKHLDGCLWIFEYIYIFKNINMKGLVICLDYV